MRTKTKKRLTLLLSGLCLIVLVAVAAYAYRQRSIAARTQQYLADGMAAVAAEDRQAALHHLGMYLLRSQSQEARVLFEYARARAEVELPDRRHLFDAMKVLQQVVRRDPSHDEARRMLLDLYTRLGRGTEAVELADSFLTKNPDDIDALRAKARALTRIGRFQEALAVAERYAELDADDPQGWFTVLDIMRRLDARPEQIVARAEALRNAHPDAPRFDLLMGHAYALANDRANAEAWARRAAQHRFETPELVRILVTQLDRLMLFDESMRVLAESASLDPEVRRDLVRRLWEAEEYERLLAELSDLTPGEAHAASSPDLPAYKAMTLLQLDRRDEAVAFIESIGRIQGNARARAWSIFLREISKPDVQAQRLVEVCVESLSNDQNNTAVRFTLGVAYEQLGETELAIKAWQQCKNERLNWHEPLVRMAQAYLETGRPERAGQAAAEAAARAPENAEVVITYIAASAAMSDRLSKAEAAQLLEVIAKVQESLPMEPTTLAIQVDLLARFGTRAEAAAVARRAMESDRVDAATLLQLAEISRRHGLELDEALLARVQQREGRTPELVLAQAMALRDAGQVDAGRALLHEAVLEADAGQRVAFNLAQAHYLDLIKHADALVVWRELVRANPDDIVVQRHALDSPAVQKDRALMDLAIEQLRRLTGDAGITWRLARARFLLDSDKVEQDAAIAASLLNEAIRLAPGRVEPQLLLVEAMEKLGDPAGATERLAKAADLHPESTEIALELAERLIRRRDAARARTYLQRVLRSESATAGARRAAAAMLVDLGDVDQAVELLEQETASSPTPPEPDLLHATLYWRQGRTRQAEQIVEKLLEKPDVERIRFAADFYASIGRPEQAQAALARLDSAGITPLQRELVLAGYAQRHGTIEDALSHYRHAVDVVPDSEDAWQGYISLLLLTGSNRSIEQAIVAASAAMPASDRFKALQQQWPAAATLGDPLPEPVRPVLLSLVIEPQQIAAATQTIELLIDADRRKIGGDALAERLRVLADRHPLYWPLQSLAIESAMAAGRHEDAVKLATRAAETFPNAVEPVSLASEALGSIGRWAESLVHAQEWRKRAYRDPAMADAMIAEARLQMGDARQAIAQLAPYVEEARRRPDVYGTLLRQYARALVLDRRHEEASALLWPIAQNDATWRAHVVALAAHDVSPPAAAVAWIEAMDQMAVSDAPAERVAMATGWFDLAQRVGDPSLLARARAVLSPLVEANNPPAAALLVLGFCDEIEGDLASAQQHYRQALARDPTAAIALNNLAMVLLRTGGDPAEAHTLAARAVELQPGNPSFLHTLALSLRANRRNGDAIETIRKATQIDPAGIEWQLTLGELLVENGQLDKAAAPLVQVDQLLGRGVRIDDAQRQRLQQLRQAVADRNRPATSAVSSGS